MAGDRRIGDEISPEVSARCQRDCDLSDEILERICLNDGSIEASQELMGEPSMTLLDFAESFGFLHGFLLPGETVGPAGSAVESISWGRIKASLIQ